MGWPSSLTRRGPSSVLKSVAYGFELGGPVGEVADQQAARPDPAGLVQLKDVHDHVAGMFKQLACCADWVPSGAGCCAGGASTGGPRTTVNGPGGRPEVEHVLNRGESAVGEFEDSALLATFGTAGLGAFPASAMVHEELLAGGQLQMLGACDRVFEHFFAIGTEKKVQHPLVQQLLQANGTPPPPGIA